jgi:hypothetical protein
VIISLSGPAAATLTYFRSASRVSLGRPLMSETEDNQVIDIIARIAFRMAAVS